MLESIEETASIIKSMQEDYDKFCSMDIDGLTDYEIWLYNFSKHWDGMNLNQFLEKKESLAKKGIVKNTELELLPKNIKDSVKTLLENKEKPGFEDVLGIIKRNKIGRQWNGIIFLNKKTGRFGAPNVPGYSSNMKVARILNRVLGNIYKITETGASKERRLTNPQKDRSYKIEAV